MCFVRLLKHWHKEQMMQIKWGKHFSEPFYVSNGVRQGGVLSAYLFAVYSDDLSNELNNIKAGCYIGEVLIFLIYLFMSRHEVHSMNTHTLQNAGR